MTNVQELLTKKHAIASNMDPFGTEWGIGTSRISSLYHIVKVVDGEPIVPQHYPKGSDLDGKFTKATLAHAAVSSYIQASWVESEAVAAKAAGRQRRKDELAEKKTEE
jgi:hypothetical protein